MIKENLGKRFVCVECGCRFYDMKKPNPICPKCGFNQKTAPGFGKEEKKKKKYAKRVPEIPEEEALDDEEEEKEGEDEETEEEEEEEIVPKVEKILKAVKVVVEEEEEDKPIEEVLPGDARSEHEVPLDEVALEGKDDDEGEET